MAAIGMMDPAFFVGRRAILDWLNATFKMALSKIEETASGAVACQLLDAIYPGEVSMQRVRWDAKSAHEFIDNYKVIQAVFEKKGVDKYLDVEKLMRGKYQDNLENMQWFKSFFERTYPGQPYDPILRRAKGKGANSMPAFALEAARRAAVGPSLGEEGEQQHPALAAAAPRGAASKAARSSMGPNSTLANSQSGGGMASSSAAAAKSLSPVAGGGGGSSHAAVASLSAQLASSQAQVSSLTANVADLRLSVESLEKERDFYFGKLRDVEILLQSYSGPDRPTVDALFKILYLADDEFVSVAGEEAKTEGEGQ